MKLYWLFLTLALGAACFRGGFDAGKRRVQPEVAEAKKTYAAATAEFRAAAEECRAMQTKALEAQEKTRAMQDVALAAMEVMETRQMEAAIYGYFRGLAGDPRSEFYKLCRMAWPKSKLEKRPWEQ